MATLNKIEILTGAPGTGKTTAIATIGKNLLEEGNDLTIVSLTKVAAEEVRRRGLNETATRNYRTIQMKTLHSLAYEALEKPTMATGKEIIDEWNLEHPQLQIDSKDKSKQDADSYLPQHTQQDPVSEYNLRRARGELIDDMPPLIQDAGMKWEAFKKEGGLLDFEDLLQVANRDVTHAPGDPHALFVDEAQDHSASEMALAVKWGLAADYLLVVGDEDQCIYSWRGATPEALRIKGAKHYALPQSYRVPRQVYKYARGLLGGISDRRDTDFKPRDAEGEVILRPDINLNRDSIPLITQVEADIDRGMTVMILTSCGYMLANVLKGLRMAGLPYHNPFRPDENIWNPFRFSNKTINYLQRAAAWYAYYSDTVRSQNIKQDELKFWTPLLKLEAMFDEPYPFKRDALDKGLADIDAVRALLKTEAKIAMAKGDLTWLYNNSQKKYKKLAPYTKDYYYRVLERYGATMSVYTAKEPKVIVSTVHGVKGGEADSVYLFNDLSRRGRGQWLGSYEGRDALLRMFYVGATRAKTKLTICGRLGV